MIEKQVKSNLQKTLYLKNIEDTEVFIKRLRGYIKKFADESKTPPSLLLSDMIYKIIKDIKEKDTEKIKHKILRKNKHICFKYYYEEILELVNLGWKSYKIKNFLNSKKKCKSPSRPTIDKFIKDIETS